MNIDKAIESLDALLPPFKQISTEEKRDAIKLGIQALKAWKEDRQGLEEGEYELLPGETEE